MEQSQVNLPQRDVEWQKQKKIRKREHKNKLKGES